MGTVILRLLGLITNGSKGYLTAAEGPEPIRFSRDNSVVAALLFETDPSEGLGHVDDRSTTIVRATGCRFFMIIQYIRPLPWAIVELTLALGLPTIRNSEQTTHRPKVLTGNTVTSSEP